MLQRAFRGLCVPSPQWTARRRNPLLLIPSPPDAQADLPREAALHPDSGGRNSALPAIRRRIGGGSEGS